MTMAAGALALTASPSTPAANADTVPAPAQASGKRLTLAEFAKLRDTTRDAARATGLVCRDIKLTSLANNQLVSVEFDYTGNYSRMLRARTDPAKSGDLEAFVICDYGSYVSLRTWGSLPDVSVELDYTGADYGMLRARSNTVDTWEKFTLECHEKKGYCALKSQANNKYVSAELAYTAAGYGMLRARSGSVGLYEKFK